MPYSGSKVITIDHTKCGSSDSTNYPLGFIGTYSYLATVANGGLVTSASGFDIIFTSDAAGTSILPFERVYWVAATGECEFWVQIPTLSHTVDTVIYVFYGNSAVTTDQSNRNSTWDSNFVGVWHFGSPTSLDLTDSTSNANNGTNHGATATTGKIGGAANFVSASSQYVDLGNGASLNITGSISVEAWVTLVGTGMQTFGGNYGVASLGWGFQNAGGTTITQWFTGGIGGSGINNTNTLNYNSAPASMVLTYDGTTRQPYQNGGNTTGTSNTTGSNLLEATTNNVYLGAANPLTSITQLLDGWIDELRVSNIFRPVAYQLQTYNNTNSPSTFYALTNNVNSALTQTAADSINNLSDAIKKLLGILLKPADSNNNLSDAVAFQLDIFSGALGIQFSDRIELVSGLALLGGGPDFSLLLGDRQILRDFPSVAITLSEKLSENLNLLQDAFIVLLGIPIQAFDTLQYNLLDLITVKLGLTLHSADSLSFSDAVSLLLKSIVLPIVVGDSINFLVDTLNLWNIIRIIQSDNFVLSDSQAYFLQNLLAVADAVSLSDSARVTTNGQPRFGDSTNSLADAVRISMFMNYALHSSDQLPGMQDSALLALVDVYNPYSTMLRIRRYLNDLN